MIIKASSLLRNNYSSISDMARETQEPIYITRNGEGDVVLMNIEAFERREQLLNLREKVLKAEQDRLNGVETYDIDEVRKILKERLDGK